MNNWDSFKKLLFKIDAERAHEIVLRSLQGIHHSPGGDFLLKKICGVPDNSNFKKSVWNIDFLNPVGLAAGFDKNCHLLPVLPALGFGFAEIGTVTLEPQSGNEKPRLAREPTQEALFNRMGFNNDGAACVAERLNKVREHLPQNFRVGVNIGKNKEVPNAEAPSNYAKALSHFKAENLDYVVVNVSSPNTPGLRLLQEASALKPIIEAVAEVMTQWSSTKPLLLKLGPEIKGPELRALIQACEGFGVNGWILTNTLAGTYNFHPQKLSVSPQVPGGWSGAPLSESSRESLAQARAYTELPLISVGGIMTPEEAMARFKLGASLIQVYSGWIYRGPGFIGDLLRGSTTLT